jgi:hypothetical protein
MGLKKAFKKVGKFVKKNSSKIVGGLSIAGGAALALTGVGAGAGAGLAGVGLKALSKAKNVADTVGASKVGQVAKALAPALPSNKANPVNQDMGSKKLFGLGNKVTKSGLLESVKEAALKTSKVVDAINEPVEQQEVKEPEKKGFFKNPIFIALGAVVLVVISLLIFKKRKGPSKWKR